MAGRRARVEPGRLLTIAAASAAASPNLRANGETRADQFLPPRVVQREAAKHLAAIGMDVSPAVLRLIVGGFIRYNCRSLADLERVLTDLDSDQIDHITRLAHADPTPALAIRNLEAGGRNRRR